MGSSAGDPARLPPRQFLMSGRTIERWHPCVLAVLSAAIAAAFANRVPHFPVAVAAGTMTLGVVVAGFTATQRNMLLSMGGSRIMRFAVKSGRYEDVLAYLKHCIWWGLTATAVSIARFFVDECVLAKHDWAWTLWLAACIGVLVGVLASIVRNERLMFIVIGQFIRESR